MTADRAAAAPHVLVNRQGDHIRWVFVNGGAEAVWAYVRVPIIVDGRLEAVDDAAYVVREGDTAVLRLVDTPVPEGLLAERVTTGAVRVEPGARVEGSLAAPAQATPEDAYAGVDAAARFSPQRWVVEIGWIPASPGLPGEPLPYRGGTTEAPDSDFAEGGQRLARSPALPR